jgi:hypothetical protein
MEAKVEPARALECPSCGGAGGGPFGRAGSAWDDETYVCPRCKGAGALALDDVMVQSQRPGLVKAVPDAGSADERAREIAEKKRKASA